MCFPIREQIPMIRKNWLEEIERYEKEILELEKEIFHRKNAIKSLNDKLNEKFYQIE